MADLVGRQFGNYRLQRLLGEGGFAQVYLGEHIHLGNLAAIKVLHNRLGQEDQEHFRSEARTIVRLRHPNIVRLLEFGIEGGTPFLVMDYASGGTLRQRHSKGQPLPLSTILPYVRQVANALQYAHDQKLIHRDIKPENMLLDERDEVVLSDFGIATVSQSSRYQNTQEVAGTAAYMAPEQFQGHPRPASDQYSLGIVVYEWLTGTRPFHGSFMEISGQHLHMPPPPLRDKVPTILPAIEQVVLTALAKDPRERFGSVSAFDAALVQASQDAGMGTTWPARPVRSSDTPLSTPVVSQPDGWASAPTVAQPPPLETRTLAAPAGAAPSMGTRTPLLAPGVPDQRSPRKPRRRGALAVITLLLLVSVVVGGVLFKLGGTQPGTPTVSASPTPSFCPSPTRANSAHAAYVSSDPAAGAVLATAPTQVTVHFTEFVDPTGSSLVAYYEPNAKNTANFDAEAKQQVSNGTQFPLSDAKAMTTSMQGRGNGIYAVVWNTVSADDGGSNSGVFFFGVGTGNVLGTSCP